MSLFGPKSISVHEAHQYLGRDGHVLLDVRTHEEVRIESVDGALNIPLDALAQEAHRLAAFESIHVMCRSGGRSSAATELLHGLGMRHALNVSGGIQAWQQANLPISRS